jgi:pimeloyl-ACP methyl ester carboxylesterase
VPQKSRLKWLPQALPKIGLASVSVYSVACLSLWVGQSRFIFFPQREITTQPEQYKLSYQDVSLPVQTEEGKTENIHGWWIPANRPNAKVLLFLHGNSQNIGGNLKHANRFHELGFSVFIPDYRGYGKSEGGFPSETQVYADAQTAWNYLTQQRGINPKEIFIYGHSLGGAIAIDLATKHPEAAALIVESSFTSIADMVRRDPKFAIFPVDLLLHQKFDSIHKVRSLTMPVLYIHGTADSLIPFSMSQQLFDATSSSKKLVFIPNGGHSNNATVNRSLYFSAVQNFTSAIAQIDRR